MLILLTFLQFGFNSGYYLPNANVALADSIGNLRNYSSSMQKNQVVLSYYRPYQITSYDLFSLESHLKTVQIGLAINHFGFDLYKESTISIWRPFYISSIHIGFKYNLRLLSIMDYGNRSEHSASAQLSYPLFEQVNLQVTLDHFLAAQHAFQKMVGYSLAYQSLNSFLQLSVNQYNQQFSPSIHYRQGFEFIDILSSYQFNEKQLNSGLRISWEDYQFQFAFSVHTELGISESLGIAFFY